MPDTRDVKALVDDAVAAPSVHNAQPWRFRYLRDSGELLLYADPARALPVEDPSGRELRLGCGAALLNLRVAAERRGWEPSVTLLPEPGEPELLASVVLAAGGPAAGDLAGLYPALHRRHSSRHPFTGERIPAEVLDELSGAAVAEGVRLVFPDRWHVETLLDLLRDAGTLEAASDEVLAEVARWTSGAGRGEGVPVSAYGPRPRDGRAAVRDFAGPRSPSGSTAAFEKAPCLALLGTREDRPVDWLRAGQGLERVLLRATLDGLAVSLDSQALEWPELRWALRDPQSAMGHVQMLLRLGYGPEAPATPRRPVDEVLTIV
nr:nitroreductase [Streptomyces sulfonofaciens]